MKRQNTDPLSYWRRTYRERAGAGLVRSTVRMLETDLEILAPGAVEDRALVLVSELRQLLEEYIRARPEFLHSLAPLSQDPEAPPLIRGMLAAGLEAGVGPMAAVAGALAEQVGQILAREGCEEVIVENGGDIYISRKQSSTVAIFAGSSPFSGKIAIRLSPDQMPCGICTSSASVGHSLSMGRADAAVVVAPSTALADALATRLGNETGRGAAGMKRALAVAKKTDNIYGCVIVAGDRLGAWGDIELTGAR